MKSLFQICTITVICMICADVNAQWSTNPSVNNQISFGSAGAAVPYVVNHPGGTMYIGWFTPEAPSGHYFPWIQKLDAFGNIKWGPSGIKVSSHPSDTWITDYDLAVCPDTSVLIAFQDRRTGSNDVFIYKLSPAGDFLWGPDGVQLSDDPNFEANPTMAVNPDNSVTIAWPREMSSGDNQVVVQHLDSDGNLEWNPPLQMGEPGFDYAWPVAVPDGDGNTILVWFKEYGPYWAPNRIILVQKFSPQGTPLWPSNATLFTGAMPLYVHPLVAGDGSGGAYVCWTYEKTLNKLSSFVQHVDHDGTVTMPAGGVNVSTNSGTLQLEPGIACDITTQDLYVFWRETNLNQTQFGLAGQCIRPDGTILWGTTGKLIVPLSSKNASLVNVSAIPGGAIASYDYDDFGGVTEQKVKAFRIDNSGTLLWTPNIKDISSVQSSKGYLYAGDFMNGQVIFTWNDDRGGGEQIFAQNISESGTMGPLDYDFGIYPDTLYFITPDDFQYGKEFSVINPNPNTLDIQHIDQFGDMNCYCAPWLVDPYIPSFPVLISPGDSLNRTVRFAAIDNPISGGMAYDSLFISTISDSKWIILAADSTYIWVGNEEKEILHSNVYPNPFTGNTYITITSPSCGQVDIRIFDMTMRMINQIPAGMLNQGVNNYFWNGTDQDGSPVSPGIYILEIKTSSQSKIIKILKN